MMDIIFALPLWCGIAFLGVIGARAFQKTRDLLTVVCLFWIGALLLLVATAIGWLLCLQAHCPIELAPWLGLLVAALFGRQYGSLAGRLACAEPTTPWKAAAVFVVCVVLANLPTIWFFDQCIRGGEPRYFLSADQPFMFGHMQALVHYGRPLDLDFAGREVRYHFGHALVAAIVTKALWLPSGIGFFVATAAIVRTAVAAGLMLIMSAFVRDRKVSWVALLLGTAVFYLIMKVNVLELLSHGIWTLRAAPSIMLDNRYEGNLELATALMFSGIVLALAQSPWLLGLCLGYLGFCKPMEGFVPFGFAVTVVAAYVALRRREYAILYGIAIAILVLASVHSFGFASGRLAGASLVFNKGNFSRMTQGAYGAVQGLTRDAAAGDTLPGRLLAYGIHTSLRQTCALAIIVLIACRIRGWRPFTAPARLVLTFCGLMALGAWLLPLGLAFKTTAGVELCYRAVNSGGYHPTFAAGANANLAQTAVTVTLMIQVLAALVVAWGVANRGRGLTGLVAILLLGNAVLYAVYLTRHPLDYPEFIDTRQVRSVLCAADRHALILTNELHLRARDGVRKFNNYLFPSLYGHRFYASAFFYLNAFDDAAIQRLHDVEQFWDHPPDDAAVRQARAWGIRYLLIRRDALGHAAWKTGQTSAAFRERAANDDYRLLEVEPRD